MDIIKNRDGKKLDVKLTGKLDTKTSPELTDALKDELDDVEELNFDFSELIYISSSGLRVILSTYKIMNKQQIYKIAVTITTAILTCLAIALGLQSCNVTRTVTTRSEAWQKGDTSVVIQTRTIESYDGTRK